MSKQYSEVAFELHALSLAPLDVSCPSSVRRQTTSSTLLYLQIDRTPLLTKHGGGGHLMAARVELTAPLKLSIWRSPERPRARPKPKSAGLCPRPVGHESSLRTMNAAHAQWVSKPARHAATNQKEGKHD